MKKFRLSGLLISIAIPEILGLLSGFLAGNSGDLYNTLVLPPFAPPGWVFPVVWTVLYALMGIAAYIVYLSSAPSEQKQSALRVYAIQLFVNFLWPIVFFRFESYLLAAIIILLLICLVVVTMLRFYQISKPAAYLLVPYLLWLFIAAYLNIGIVILN